MALRTISRFSFLALGCASALACSPNASGDGAGQVEVVARTSSALSVSDVRNVEITVTGAAIATPIVSELAHEGAVWHGTIGEIPVGIANFDGNAFDNQHATLYAGSAANVAIRAGTTAIVGLLMQQSNAPPAFEDTAPVIDAFTASTNVVAPGAGVTVSGVAHRPGPGALTYAWTADGGSFASDTSATTVWTAPEATGTYSLTFKATDAAGLTAGVTFTLSVQNGSAAVTTTFNTWPTIGGMTASPTRIDVGETTQLGITATDADDDSLSYAWTSTCDGTFDATNGASVSFTLGALPAAGSCAFTSTVADGRGGSNTGTVRLKAGPAPQLSISHEPTTAYHWINDSLKSFDGTTWATVDTNAPQGNLGGQSYIGVVGGKIYQNVYNWSGTYSLQSFDGTTWATVATNTPQGNLGSQSYIGALGGKVYHNVYQGSGYGVESFDGTTWAAVTTNMPSGNLGIGSYLGVIHDKAYHWIYQGGSSALYAFDGATWESLSANTPSGNLGNGSFLGVIHDKAYHWVYQGSGFALYAFDGATWESISTNTPNGNLGNDSYVGVLDGKAYHWVYDWNGTYGLQAFDGATWTSVSSNTPRGNVGGFLSDMGSGSYLGAL